MKCTGIPEDGLYVSPEQLADALLADVYCPVTALVSLDARGAVLAVRLFDTLYAPLPKPAQGCASALVLFGHPEGWRTLHPEEERRLAKLRERLGSRPMRVFLAGDELGCVELTADGTKAAG